MKILEYIDLDTSRVEAGYRKVVDAIARHDFRAAQVKKLANLGHGKFYRAKLNDADRLLFSLVRHRDQVSRFDLLAASRRARQRIPSSSWGMRSRKRWS